MLLKEEVRNTNYKTNSNPECACPYTAKPGNHFPVPDFPGESLVSVRIFLYCCLFLFWVTESIDIRLGWLYHLIKHDVNCVVVPHFFLYDDECYNRSALSKDRIWFSGGIWHVKGMICFFLLTRCNEKLGWKPSQKETPCGALVFAGGHNARGPRHGGLCVLACDMYRGHFKTLWHVREPEDAFSPPLTEHVS